MCSTSCLKLVSGDRVDVASPPMVATAETLFSETDGGIDTNPLVQGTPRHESTVPRVSHGKSILGLLHVIVLSSLIPF